MKTQAYCSSAILIISAVLLCLPAAVFAAEADSGSAASSADAEWAQLENILNAPAIRSNEDRIGYFRQREQRALQYRSEGLALFEKYPDDPRRWEWLVRTLRNAPQYWADPDQGAQLMEKGRRHEASIDTAAAGRWEALLRGRLVPQFLASSQATSKQRADYFLMELNKAWDRAMEHDRRKEPVPEHEVEEFVEILAMYAAEPATAEGSSVSGSVNKLHTLMRLADFSRERRWAVVNTFKFSPNEKLRQLAGGMEAVLKLHEEPLELRLTTLDGRPYDVADLRGKVALVDFWSTSCSSCVAAMPKIKEVYQRYRDNGFEVIGVCLDDEKNRDKVEEILRKVEAPWETAFESWETSPLRERFQFIFVPVYFLLDRDGRLVTTDVYGKEKLETEVRRLLEL